MIERGSCIYIDTMIIIEACKLGCWNDLSGAYSLQTVSKCIEEIDTGNMNPEVETRIITDYLRLNSEKVDGRDVFNFEMQLQGRADPDDGEKELLSHVLKLKSKDFFICCCDKAGVRSGYYLGLLDLFVSLEDLLRNIGNKTKLRYHFTNNWLSQFKTQLRLEE